MVKKEMGLEPIYDKSLEDFEKVFVKEESALESVKLEPKVLGDTQDLDELNLLDPLKEVAQWDQIEPLKEDVKFFKRIY